jgi:hypothetical protein
VTLPSPTNRTLSTRQLHHVKTTSARSVDFSLPDRPSARRRESPTKKTTQRSRLDVGGVEHDADGSAEGLGGEVVAELGAHNTGVAVRAGDLAPDHANVGAADLTLGAVDESDLLAKVEVGGLGVINTLNLDQAGVGSKGVLATLVAEVTSLDVKAVSLFGRHCVGVSL